MSALSVVLLLKHRSQAINVGLSKAKCLREAVLLLLKQTRKQIIATARTVCRYRLGCDLHRCRTKCLICFSVQHIWFNCLKEEAKRAEIGSAALQTVELTLFVVFRLCCSLKHFGALEPAFVRTWRACGVSLKIYWQVGYKIAVCPCLALVGRRPNHSWNLLHRSSWQVVAQHIWSPTIRVILRFEEKLCSLFAGVSSIPGLDECGLFFFRNNTHV